MDNRILGNASKLISRLGKKKIDSSHCIFLFEPFINAFPGGPEEAAINRISRNIQSVFMDLFEEINAYYVYLDACMSVGVLCMYASPTS